MADKLTVGHSEFTAYSEKASCEKCHGTGTLAWMRPGNRPTMARDQSRPHRSPTMAFTAVREAFKKVREDELAAKVRVEKALCPYCRGTGWREVLGDLHKSAGLVPCYCDKKI